jgi:hydroxymethylglutaryl-CoA reductase
MMCAMRWAPTRSILPLERIGAAGGENHRRAGALLRILSNLADRRLARARCTIPLEELTFENFRAERCAMASLPPGHLPLPIPYRAATHNKGIMNGVDAVVIATGNDWRAVEAGAHAYAARSGRYTSLSTLGQRCGRAIWSARWRCRWRWASSAGRPKCHPAARVALKLHGREHARELAEIIVSVGLAQNLAALRALATEGIQRGHMALHARQVAIAAGAQGEANRTAWHSNWWRKQHPH